MSVKVERYNPETKEFEPFVFKSIETVYYWLTEDLRGDPTSVESDDKKFTTAEEARLAGLAALNKLDEGVVTIWKNQSDIEGNGESEILWEYRREKKGPSITREIDLSDE